MIALVLRNKETGHTHALRKSAYSDHTQKQDIRTYSSNTHGGDSHALVLPTELGKRSHNLAGSRAAQGMTEGTNPVSQHCFDKFQNDN